MSEKKLSITDNIIRDMREGLMVLDRKGKILIANERAQELLNKRPEDLIGRSFASVFIEEKRNDKFNQAVLNAIYEPNETHSLVCSYYAGEEEIRFFQVVTSSLYEEQEDPSGGGTPDSAEGADPSAGKNPRGVIEGIIVMISDITTLIEVKAHLKLMKKIEVLNEQLQKKSEFIRSAFSRYLSDEVVDKILNTPGGLDIGGSLTNITILMSDLRGFTALCEKMDPNSMIRMLNHYLEIMGRIIKEMHGTVIEYLGDGILAIFGDPVKTENHASDGVRAAILMQKAMKEINEWNRERGYPMLRMGIGVNSGEAIVGNVGSEFAVRYNAMGSSVNLCGRIESYTSGDQVFISGSTKEMLDAEVILRETREVSPKGVSEPLILYSISGLGAPYDISFDVETEELVPLPKEMPAVLLILDGKHISDKEEEAVILAKSADQMQFRTDVLLNVLDNVVLKTNITSYGKIEKREGNVYTMTITSQS
ncbi:MAG: PAS domain-containing protein [Lachnospiraceae bacterium]|nr:PAS domain-containing protein [Lachnospiraceae bacterium]